MDRRLRRAPDAEWVLVYRLGLSRQRIAELVRAHPALVWYHLVIARRQDPGLEAAHRAATVAKPRPFPGSLARMDEAIAWIRSGGRLPRDRSEHQEERSMARWLRSVGAKQPTAAFTRPAGTASRRSPGGPGTPGQQRTRPGGMTASTSWRTSAPKATGPGHHHYASETRPNQQPVGNEDPFVL
jgi:hypothetical protein